MKDGLYPIVTGKNSFRELIESGRPYVDKTEILFNLLSKPSKYYTFSRPDGFGKSTLLDTIEAIFKGEKELFRGLFIEDKWNFEDTYPVIRLSMKDLTAATAEGNGKILMERLGEYAEQYELTDKDLYPAWSPGSLYGNLLREIHRKTGKKVVVLIDDFDDLLLKNIQSMEWNAYCRLVYHFLSMTKPENEHIRFFFMTGLTNFMANEFCPDFYNVIDISDDPDYAAICGYTDEEIDKYFSPCFEKHFKKAGITSDEEKTAFRNRVREYYGGYRFSARNPVTLYNPVSIGKFAESGCVFANYWKDADVQPLVKELIKANAEYLKEKEEFRSIAEKATIFDVQELIQEKASYSIVYSFLLQTGWLSSGMVDKYHWVTMRYPNREVEETMAEIIGEA